MMSDQRLDSTLTVNSGGQAGVDRAAHDVAIALAMSSGGWCPNGRLAEDGPIPFHYPLRETATADPAVRTELNVIFSDATLILSAGEPQDGTNFTRECAIHHGKPLLKVDLDNLLEPSTVREWITRNQVRTLNVAGPRESHRPGFMYRCAFDYLMKVFKGE